MHSYVIMQCATHRNLGWRIRVVDPPSTGNPVDVGNPGSNGDDEDSDSDGNDKDSDSDEMGGVEVLGLGDNGSSSLPAATLTSLPLLLLLSLLSLAAATTIV